VSYIGLTNIFLLFILFLISSAYSSYWITSKTKKIIQKKGEKTANGKGVLGREQSVNMLNWNNVYNASLEEIFIFNNCECLNNK
jgi:hypothetical protein